VTCRITACYGATVPDAANVNSMAVPPLAVV
jgi:hypothetical protein